MKRTLWLVFICCLSLKAAVAQQPDPSSPAAVHVSTALNHLTVLEYHEPVTMAAAGSGDFQIERQENKVFVKPLKTGAATDLFVWTASRRFAYELETTEEVKNMTLSIDNPVPVPTAPPAVSVSTDQLADLMLTRAFLGMEVINNVGVRSRKNQVNVRVEKVFRTRTSVYVHYTIVNNSPGAYHVDAPGAVELRLGQSSIPIESLLHRQLDERELPNLRSAQIVSLPVAHDEHTADELEPGGATQGVLTIRRVVGSPSVVQLVFVGGIKATVVL